jgi:hypothetical protein
VSTPCTGHATGIHARAPRACRGEPGMPTAYVAFHEY